MPKLTIEGVERELTAGTLMGRPVTFARLGGSPSCYRCVAMALEGAA